MRVRPAAAPLVLFAAFVIDSGGGAFLLTEKLADAIGLKASGPARKAEGAEFAPATPSEVRVGGMPLDLKGARVMIQYGKDHLEERDAVDGLFPGHVLERYHVIFDYPARKFTLAAPGSVKPRGTGRTLASGSPERICPPGVKRRRPNCRLSAGHRREFHHRSVQTVRRYIRDGSLFRENSAGKLGL